MTFKPKQGDIIEVTRAYAEWPGFHVKFVVFHNNAWHCEDTAGSDELVPWYVARDIPEEEPEHYTAETFPKGEVWITMGVRQLLIVGMGADIVYTKDGYIPFNELHEYKISTDGRATWEKAVPGGGKQ